MLWHIMSQSSSCISFSSEDAGYDWEQWAMRGHRGHQFKTQDLFLKQPKRHPQSRSNKQLMLAHIKQWHVQRSMNLSSCAPPPASSLSAGPYGRCQSNWSLLSSSLCPVSEGERPSGFLRVPLCSGRAGTLHRPPCSRALTKLAANCKYKVSLQFPASRETQAPRTMDTCQTIAVIQGHFGSPNWRLLAPVLSALPSARSTGSRS